MGEKCTCGNFEQRASWCRIIFIFLPCKLVLARILAWKFVFLFVFFSTRNEGVCCYFSVELSRILTCLDAFSIFRNNFANEPVNRNSIVRERLPKQRHPQTYISTHHPKSWVRSAPYDFSRLHGKFRSFQHGLRHVTYALKWLSGYNGVLGIEPSRSSTVPVCAGLLGVGCRQPDGLLQCFFFF